MTKIPFEKIVYGLPNCETKFSPDGRIVAHTVDYKLFGVLIYRKRSSNILEIYSNQA